MTRRSPFRYFKTSPEVIRLAVMMYIRFPLPLRNVEDLLHVRGIDISHETVRFWWNRFGPMFAAEIRKRRVEGMRSSHWTWHRDEIFVKINGERHYLWRGGDHEGEALESFVTKKRDKKAALRFLRKTTRRHGRSEKFITALVPEAAYRTETRVAREISYIANHTADREGALTRSKDGLFIVRGEHLVAAQDVLRYELKDAKATADRTAQLEQLIDMRQAYADLITAERSVDGNPEPARTKLQGALVLGVKGFKEVGEEANLLTAGHFRHIDDALHMALGDGIGDHLAVVLGYGDIGVLTAENGHRITNAVRIVLGRAAQPPPDPGGVDDDDAATLLQQLLDGAMGGIALAGACGANNRGSLG